MDQMTSGPLDSSGPDVISQHSRVIIGHQPMVSVPAPAL
jgi:hypothetical protein